MSFLYSDSKSVAQYAATQFIDAAIHAHTCIAFPLPQYSTMLVFIFVLVNQYLAVWRGLCSTQRQARKLISCPSPATKNRLLSFNRTQYRVITGLLTGHNTLRRHLYIVGLNNNPTLGSVVRSRKPQSTFCVNAMPWLLYYMHIWVPCF